MSITFHLRITVSIFGFSYFCQTNYQVASIIALTAFLQLGEYAGYNEVDRFKDADEAHAQAEAQEASGVGNEGQDGHGFIVPDLGVERVVDEDLQDFRL